MSVWARVHTHTQRERLARERGSTRTLARSHASSYSRTLTHTTICIYKWQCECCVLCVPNRPSTDAFFTSIFLLVSKILRICYASKTLLVYKHVPPSSSPLPSSPSSSSFVVIAFVLFLIICSQCSRFFRFIFLFEGQFWAIHDVAWD